MAQKQGRNRGRLDGSSGTAVAAADFAVGAGWGATGSITSVGTGSNDQAGTFVVTAAGGTYAQATATVVLTYKDGAYAAAPRAVLVTCSNAVALDTGHVTWSSTTTALTLTYLVLPAAGAYTFTYAVIA